MVESSGLLLFCGTVAWKTVGRKKPSVKEQALSLTEYPAPNRYGPAAYINVQKAISHGSSAHIVLIDDAGVSYTFGRNEKGQLGDGTTNDRSDPFKVVLKDEVVVSAAVGRSHTVLLTKTGKLYACGENKSCQLGLAETQDIRKFVHIAVNGVDRFVAVSCGVDFTIAVTDKGNVVAWGNPQYGQLGDGSDHGYIKGTNRMVYQPQPPKRIAFFDDKKIVDVSSGNCHSVALDDEGRVYVWGAGGFGRLGLNEMPPKDTMVPKELLGYFKDRGNNPIKKIVCGPTCTMAIDSRSALHLWGKWKNTGDGGQGTPWLYPKLYMGLSGWAVRDISAGGVSLFSLADQSCISWGQNASYGELGFGPNEPRSATNAQKVQSLEGIATTGIACGLGHTLIVVDRADPKVAALPVCLDLIEVAPPSKPTITLKLGSPNGASKKRKSSKDEGNASDATAAKKGRAEEE